MNLDCLEKVRKIFSALNVFGRKLHVFWEGIPKARAEGKTMCFWWEAKKYKIIALIGFWVFFSLMIFKNPKPEEANCPNLDSHKPDFCNQPLINRDLLWL